MDERAGTEHERADEDHAQATRDHTRSQHDRALLFSTRRPAARGLIERLIRKLRGKTEG